VNNGSNSDLYIDNTGAARNTQLDGLTVVLECTAPVNSKETNTLKLAIADAGDASFDSAVFLQAQSLVSPEVDLSVTKVRVGDEDVAIGDIVTYDIDVSNADEVGTATNVVLTDTLDGPGVIQSADEGCLIAGDGKSATCDVGELSSGSSASFTLTVLTNGPGELVNSVSVTSEEADLNSEDNQFIAAAVVVEESEVQVDLSITKTDAPPFGPDPVAVNQVVGYQIIVSNDSDTVANAVSVTDTSQEGNPESASGDGWSCGEPSDGSITCTLDSPLPANSDASELVVLVRAPESVPDENVMANTATVSSEGEDSTPLNNADTEETTVVPASEEDSVTGFIAPGGTLVSDGGVTGPDNQVSARIILEDDGTAGIYTLSEFFDPAGSSKGAAEYTGPDPFGPLLVEVSCDESLCPLEDKVKKDLFLLIKKLNPDGTEVVLSSCESTVKVRGEPTIVERDPPCVVSVVRNPLTAEINPGDLVWTVRVLGEDPIIKAR
jgi:uncharacterized repeat protein (TIGR01451 family)